MTYRSRVEEGPRCHFHELAAATEACARCGVPLCHVCLSFSASSGVACPGCERALLRRRAWKGAGLVAGVLAAGCGAVVAYFSAIAHEPLPPAGLPAAERALKETPCGEDAMLAVDEILRRAGRDPEAIERSEAFLAACGHTPRVLWKIHAAHNRLGQHEQAEKAATRLIEHSPLDKDYWWWRAESRKHLGKLEEAAADYEQVIALQPSVTTIPVRLARLYPALGRPCDGIFPLVQLLHYHPDQPDGPSSGSLMTAMDLASELATSTECRSLSVAGQAFLPLDKDLRARGEAAIDGGEKGVFLVDEAVSPVLVQKAFAARIGLAVGPRTLRVRTPSGLQEARLAIAGRLDIGGASAPRVPIAVVEEVPEGTVGVLGLAFLLRFRVDPSEKGYALSPPPVGGGE